METTLPPGRKPETENGTLDSPQDLARVCRTTPQTINAWHRKGILPAKVCIGRVIRFDRAEALAALEKFTREQTGRASA